MAFMATNPITAPEASSQPPTPPLNMRGLFPCPDGWYDISHDGSVEKLSKGALLLWQSGRAYSAGEFVIADYNGGHAIFKCVKNVSKESGVQVTNQKYWLFLKYMSVAVDNTLTVEGAAADAKSVGDKLANKPELFTVTANVLYNEVDSSRELTDISSTYSEMLEAHKSGKILRLVLIDTDDSRILLNLSRTKGDFTNGFIEFRSDVDIATIRVTCNSYDTWSSYVWASYGMDAVDSKFEQLEKQIEDIIIGESNIIVDQSYNSKSENAQSGTAVAEALQNTENKTNKVTVIDKNSDDEYYPSALAVKTYADGLKPYIMRARVSEDEESWQISDCDTKFTTITDVMEQGREVVLGIANNYFKADYYATLVMDNGVEYVFELTEDGCIYRFTVDSVDTWRTEIIKLDNKVNIINDSSDDEHYPSALAVKKYVDDAKPNYLKLDLDENYNVYEGQISCSTLRFYFSEMMTKKKLPMIKLYTDGGNNEHLTRIESVDGSGTIYFYFIEDDKQYKISVNTNNEWTTEVFEYATKEDIKGIKEFFAVTATISTDESGNILITDASATFEEIQEAHKAGKTITAVGKYDDNIMEAYVSISAITEDMVVFTTVSLDGIPIVIRCFSDNTWMVSINEYATKEDLEKLDIGLSIPDITNTDEGKVLKVVNGKPAWVTDYVNAEEVYY